MSRFLRWSKRSAFLGFAFLLSLSAYADVHDSRGEYCTQSRDPYFSQRKIESEPNQLAFRNQGGFGGLGTCWWHSRFTRNATHLAVYRPDLAPPDRKRAREIIRALSRPRIYKRVEVIEIPGYSNLYEFSLSWEKEIQNRLNAWQLEEGILGLDILSRGVGASRRDMKRLEREMDDLYLQVQTGEIAYQKLQIRGIAAHAWLITRVDPTQEGYRLTVIDSNFPGETRTEEYVRGSRAIRLKHSSFGEVAPYTEFSWELERMRAARDRYCENVEH
jgi:hypothetical protein